MKKAHQKRDLLMHLPYNLPSMKRLFLRHLYPLGRSSVAIAILDLRYHVLGQGLESLTGNRIGI